LYTLLFNTKTATIEEKAFILKKPLHFETMKKRGVQILSIFNYQLCLSIIASGIGWKKLNMINQMCALHICIFS